MTPSRRQHLGRRICSDLDRMPTMQPTTVLYFVLCQHKDGRYVVERDISRMTREATVADIRTRGLTDIVSIIETEFTDTGLSSRDVTASMIMEAELMRGLAPDPIDRQDARFDHARDLRKHEAT